MRRALLALAALLVLAAIAAAAFWPDQPEPATDGTGAGQGEACTSCTLRHQRLGEPKD